MTVGRTKNSLRNGIFGIINRLVTLLFPFAIRTVIIKILGVEYLGLNSLFASILQILNLTELGVGSAIVFAMYKPIAEDNNDLICALMKLYRKLYFFIGCIVLAVGLGIMPFLRYLINGNVPADINLYLLYSIYLANSVISYWLFAHKTSLFYAHQKNSVVANATTATNILMYSIQIVFLFLFKNYYIFIICLPITSILNNFLIALLSKKYFPNIVCCGMIDKELKRDIRLRVSGLMINKLAFASRNAFDSIIISSFLGLSLLAIYNNYYYVISAIGGLLTIFISAIVPSIGNSMVTCGVEKNEQDMFVFHHLYMSVVGLCFCFFLNFFQPFMKIWVGGDFLFNNQIMIAISVYFLVEKSENIIGNYYDASGMWWHGKIKGIAEALTNLGLNILLGKFFGVFGVVIATLISMLFVGIPLTTAVLYKYYYKKRAKKYFLTHYFTLVIFLGIGAITFLLCSCFPEGDTIKECVICMLIRLPIILVTFLILYIIIFFKTNVFKQSISWIKTHLKRS